MPGKIGESPCQTGGEGKRTAVPGIKERPKALAGGTRGRRDVNVFFGGGSGEVVETRVGGGKETRRRRKKKIPRRNPGKGLPPLRVFK